MTQKQSKLLSSIAQEIVAAVNVHTEDEWFRKFGLSRIDGLRVAVLIRATVRDDKTELASKLIEYRGNMFSSLTEMFTKILNNKLINLTENASRQTISW